jgi:hypothetical protein
MNLQNWRPDLTADELRWFDKCPKAVLFEIARQFGMRIADNFTGEGAFLVMQNEWEVLHAQGIVPQRPPKRRAPQ